MENKIFSAVRFAVACVAIMGGVAALNASSTQQNPLSSTIVTMDGSHPMPLCDPYDPGCVPWERDSSKAVVTQTKAKDGSHPMPLCDPYDPGCVPW